MKPRFGWDEGGARRREGFIMPIRFAFALVQMAVYAFGTSSDVAEITKADEPCTNFRWVMYNNGTLEFLHCDDKPWQASLAAGTGDPGSVAGTVYHVKINDEAPLVASAVALSPALVEEAAREHSGVPTVDVPRTDDDASL
jgi:hypothetical protein